MVAKSKNKILRPSPYGSFSLSRTQSAPSKNIVGDIVVESKKLLKLKIENSQGKMDSLEDFGERKYSSLTVGGFYFLESTVCRWEGQLRDKNNELILICRWKSYVAIYCSNSAHRNI